MTRPIVRMSMLILLCALAPQGWCDYQPQCQADITVPQLLERFSSAETIYASSDHSFTLWNPPPAVIIQLVCDLDNGLGKTEQHMHPEVFEEGTLWFPYNYTINITAESWSTWRARSI